MSSGFFLPKMVLRRLFFLGLSGIEDEVVLVDRERRVSTGVGDGISQSNVEVLSCAFSLWASLLPRALLYREERCLVGEN